MPFDFDTPLPLAGSRSLKWARYHGRDVIPMWVADMDFAAPPAVLDALNDAVSLGHLGYAKPDKALADAVVAHLAEQYHWQIEPHWLVWLPGLVVGLNLAVQSATEPGERVFTATPIYPPFLSAPGNADRPLDTLALTRGPQRWEWDFDAADTLIARCKLWLLCHPHNPVGRLWDQDELARIAELAAKHDLIVCSDEIHCGLILDEHRPHVPLAAAAPEIAHRTITLMAPSKTFNIPGLGTAFAVIPDNALRERFKRVAAGIVPDIGILGLAGMEAAFRHGEPWRQALLAVLRSHAQVVERAIANLPGLRTTPVEATYLAWIDCRESSLDNPCQAFEHAGVGLSDGRDFGAPGFVRLNFGCPRSTLDQGLERLREALIQG